MKVLRLATSADYYPGIAPHLRMPALIENVFEQATGEPMETVIRVLYPSDVSPAMLGRWLEELRPDAVFIWVNPFWFGYESVPLRLRRQGGRLGRAAGRLARRATKPPWIARSSVFHLARRAAQRTLGSAYYYEPDEVLAAMDAWLHVILRHETVVPMVLGPWFCLYDTDEKRVARAEARRLEVNGRLIELCRRLHVLSLIPMVEPDLPLGPEWVEPDLMHPNAAAHAWLAERQAPLHIAAWRQLRGEAAPVVAAPRTFHRSW